jgi:hypothetical protein
MANELYTRSCLSCPFKVDRRIYSEYANLRSWMKAAKRVIGIMAVILASLHMQTADDLFGTPRGGVAHPIAKRRAGLLGWVAPPNGGISSMVFASGCCAVRLDLDHSLFSGHESKAADRSVRSTQTGSPDGPPIHALRIAVDIAQLLHALLVAPLFYFQSLDPELEIVIACLLSMPALRSAIGRATRRL